MLAVILFTTLLLIVEYFLRGKSTVIKIYFKGVFRILAMYEANTAKISNFLIFWSITLIIYHLFKI